MVVIRTEYLHIFIYFYLFIGLWKFGNLKPNTFGYIPMLGTTLFKSSCMWYYIWFRIHYNQ